MASQVADSLEPRPTLASSNAAQEDNDQDHAPDIVDDEWLDPDLPHSTDGQKLPNWNPFGVVVSAYRRWGGGPPVRAFRP